MTDDPSAAERLEQLIHERSPEALVAAASDARLTEDLALGLLTRRDLPAEALEAVFANTTLRKSRKVMQAVVAHPRTPRHVALPIARRLYTLELMSLALTPTLAADLKVAVEEAIITRVETIALGERLTLAKRASSRVAAALLGDSEARVIEAALANPYLTEASVVKAVAAQRASPALIDAVCREEKWSVRPEVRLALLRAEHTPLARAILFAQSLPAGVVRDVLHHSRIAENVKRYLLEQIGNKPQH